MERKEYNGWTNYETWLAALWMDNDGDMGYYRESMKEIIEDENGDQTFSCNRLAEVMKENMEERVDEMLGKNSASFVADMLNGAMSEINWYEIADHAWQDVSEEMVSDGEWMKSDNGISRVEEKESE